jgi:hypothetical protein
MTTREKLQEILEGMGMSNYQSNEVMELAIPQLDEVIESYSITWNSPSSEYPEEIYNVLILAIRPIALKWIEENKPLAWFKPMFEL